MGTYPHRPAQVENLVEVPGQLVMGDITGFGASSLRAPHQSGAYGADNFLSSVDRTLAS